MGTGRISRRRLTSSPARPSRAGVSRSQGPGPGPARRPGPLNVPPVPLPHEHAFDAAGEHFFFGYGRAEDHGCQGGTASGSSTSTCPARAGAWCWATSTARTRTATTTRPGSRSWCLAYRGQPGTDPGHRVRLSGRRALPVSWYTCQAGTCVRLVRGGRIVIVGARSGGAVLACTGRLVVRLADLEPPGDDDPSPLRDHLRMALRVTGRGLDDPRWLAVEPTPTGVACEHRRTGRLRATAVEIPGWRSTRSNCRRGPVNRRSWTRSGSTARYSYGSPRSATPARCAATSSRGWTRCGTARSPRGRDRRRPRPADGRPGAVPAKLRPAAPGIGRLLLRRRAGPDTVWAQG